MAHPDRSAGAKRDELLLRTPCDVEERDDLRLGRIHDEIERGFDALRDIDDGVSIFGSARIGEGHRWYELCRETAACLAKHGFSVITGGGPGLMEAANRGAAEAGGLSVGLNIELPMEQQTNRIKHFPTILVDSQHWAPLLDWIDHNLEDDGMIAPADKELLVVADTPDEVCDHVRRASAAQKELARPMG